MSKYQLEMPCQNKATSKTQQNEHRRIRRNILR